MARVLISKFADCLLSLLCCGGVIVASCMFLACSDSSEQGKPTERVEIKRPSEHAVNINSAGTDELEKIPHIGRNLAERIVVYRETYGMFTRTEQLLLIRGISDRRYREIRHLITVD